jgi:hypothetical protein
MGCSTTVQELSESKLELRDRIAVSCFRARGVYGTA